MTGNAELLPRWNSLGGFIQWEYSDPQLHSARRDPDHCGVLPRCTYLMYYVVYQYDLSGKLRGAAK